MKPREERLNERLEQAGWESRSNGLHPSGFTLPPRERDQDPDVEKLLELARYFQQAPQLQVAPDFTKRLERRLHRSHAERQIRHGNRRGSFFSLLRTHPALSAVLVLCLLFGALSTSVLALAAQVTNPANPLYGLKHWEQQVQVQMASSPADQATLDLQFARSQLKTLPSLADAVHADAYRQALSDLDQQVNAAAEVINTLPVGAQRMQLTGELASLKLDALHVLSHLLSQLVLPEQLATTNELARLGETVPVLRQAWLTLPAHPNERVTVSFTGSDLQSGAHLLVDGKVMQARGALQDGQLVFLVDWNGNQHPHSLGVLNPDGTATETTTILFQDASASGAPGRNQNGNGNKPSVTPTPPTSHGNKPSVTPTPHGNKPSATPVPHA